MDCFLTDFGLAKSVATGSKLTRTGEALGTPAYMSPEQARGEVSALTPATDVWSLGCLLYETVAGRRPFEGESGAAVLGAVLLCEPVPLRRLRADLSDGLDRVVRVCLAKRARHRYPDAGALRDDLDRVLEGRPPRARPAAAGRRRLVAAGAAVAVAGILALLGSLPREEPGSGPEASRDRSEAEALALQGRALAAQDPAQAADLLARALERDPGRHDWRVERGLRLWAVGRGGEAREAWSAVPASAPESVSARLYRGLEAFFRRSLEEAGPDLEGVRGAPGREGRLVSGALSILGDDWARAREALREETGWEAALLRAWVESFDPAGDRAQAVREYGTALAGGAPLAWAHSNRGVLRRQLGDPAGAVGDFTESLRLDPRLAETWNNRAYAHLATGDHARVIADASRAIELAPGLAAAWNNRGVAKAGAGDAAGAIADLEQAIRLDPGQASARKNLAKARRDSGDATGALLDFDEAIRLAPADPSAWTQRGIAWLDANRPDRAIEDFTEAIRLDPRDPTPRFNRGAARRETGDVVGAFDDLSESLRLDPGQARAWRSRAMVLRDRGDTDGAIADLTQALRLDPAEARAWSNRGALRRERGEIAEALLDYTEAIRRDPGLAEAYASRGLARGAQGDADGAVADLEKALEVADPRWPLRAAVEEDLRRARAAR